MEFRWLAILAVWTILSGPVFGPPSGGASRPKERSGPKASTKSAPAKKRAHESSTVNGRLASVPWTTDH
jgi:hypothetical protein